MVTALDSLGTNIPDSLCAAHGISLILKDAMDTLPVTSIKYANDY